MHLLLSPHNDDAVLFASFTIQALAPNILPLVIFESHVQGPGTMQARRAEDRNAMKELFSTVQFLDGIADNAEHADITIMQAIKAKVKACNININVAESVWVPEIYNEGHLQHNQIGRLGALFDCPVNYYHTYVRRVDGKVDPSHYPQEFRHQQIKEVKPYQLEHVRRKLLALACYQSQINRPDNVAHFLRDQREWRRP